MIAVAVFARPPLPGMAKSRLAGALGPDAAAALARAFLEDTWAAVARCPWAAPVLATTQPWPARALVGEAPVWQQEGEDLGARVEHILGRALQEIGPAIALGADSPGLPADRLEAARAALGEADAVLGPADDGGYYLLGVARRLDPGVLSQVRFSSAHALADTRAALQARGWSVRELPGWFDVDEVTDLWRLEVLLREEPARAPATWKVLRALGRV